MQSLCSDQNHNQIFAKRPEICVSNVGGQPSGLSNQFLVDNVSRSAATPIGLTRSNFLQKPFSFASNTGNLFSCCVWFHSFTNSNMPIIKYAIAGLLAMQVH